ncbi:hypothetical protein XU18_1233 [Perkinsela sp. CCAP 1560/4]|nr:hypothetical protein XU18_1231 [Perkinsela sp. CCAP 1560/4]KNH08224.1 hypothetical protein XU18_1232 [Perkinsela sp. CCAP 1560/4]KNH08225.1 hypothetical protein XU18_1233 [Perkinsela sp. CCAP 1560/4]|eukprot:KNH08223.1 hypothetical protein XU18_1231 [Perkinsela sp. CCAP 1560/4]
MSLYLPFSVTWAILRTIHSILMLTQLSLMLCRVLLVEKICTSILFSLSPKGLSQPDCFRIQNQLRACHLQVSASLYPNAHAASSHAVPSFADREDTPPLLSKNDYNSV